MAYPITTTSQTIPGMLLLAMLALLSILACRGAGADAVEEVDYTAMSTEALAEYLIFEAGGFKLDEATQEGGTVRDRLTQDGIQKTCSPLHGARPEGETATRVIELARESIVYPEGGIRLGDWEKGEAVAKSRW